MFFVKSLKLDEPLPVSRRRILVGVETYDPTTAGTAVSVSRKKFDLPCQTVFHFNNGEANRTIDYVVGKPFGTFPEPTITVPGMIVGNWYRTSDFSGSPVKTTDLAGADTTDLYVKWVDKYGENYALFDIRTTADNTTIKFTEIIAFTENDTIYVDWGDGQESEYVDVASNATHTYATAGAYTIKMSETTNEVDVNLASGAAETTWLEGIRRWGNIEFASNYSFVRCTGLRSIARFPDYMTIGTGSFSYCSSLASVELGLSLDIGTNVFSHSGLSSITIPDYCAKTITSICNGCSSLLSATIGNGITTVSRAFSGCASLSSATFNNQTLSTFGIQCFMGCSSLINVNVPENVKVIGSNTFGNCSSLTSLTFPSGISSVAANSFIGTAACMVFDFSNCTSVPTLGNTNAFQNTNANKKIVVPDALYDSWIAANNWNSSVNGIKEAIVKRSAYMNS